MFSSDHKGWPLLGGSADTARIAFGDGSQIPRMFSAHVSKPANIAFRAKDSTLARTASSGTMTQLPGEYVHYILLIAASVVALGPARAEPEQVLRGPAPAWAVPSALLPVPENAAGPIFIRRQDLEIHLSAQGQAQYSGYRIKILQPNALEIGNLSVVWNPTAGPPIVHEIKLYRDGQVIDVLKNATFEVLRREDQLEAAKLDGRLTAVLRVPDLRVGDELEVGVTIFSSDPTLGSDTAGLLVLGESPAPGRYRLGLDWDPGYEPTLKMTPDMTAAMTRGTRAIGVRFDNPAALSPPKDAPMRYQWQRALEYSRFADWRALSRRFAPLFTKAAMLAPDSPLKREAARIAASQPRALDRATAALKLVQGDVRYIYVGLNGGNLTPATADETWARRYGDCKGKTALLLALLSTLGIEAEPVLVNSGGLDDGLDQRLPGPQYFDHVLVRAHIEGKSYWLDGTLPSVAAPSLQPVFAFHWDLPLRTQGGALERVDWQPATAPDEITMLEIDARAGFDKPARMTSTAIVRGLKGLQQQVQFSSVTPGQMLSALRQRALGDVWQAIDDVKWHYDEKAGASVLTIVGTGIVDWDNDDGGAKSLALPGGGFSPPERRVRAAGADQSLPYYKAPEYECNVTTVRLPSTTLPKQWSSKASYDTRLFGRDYHRAWELRDGAIRMIRGSRVQQPEIDAATAQRDNGRIARFDNSMGYIFYTPTGRDGAVGSSEKVPATYEIDWAAEAVPCLSATVLAETSQVSRTASSVAHR
ncbi:MAG: DUF3857 domain-containing protein [Janthinobacterium lividum]